MCEAVFVAPTQYRRYSILYSHCCGWRRAADVVEEIGCDNIILEWTIMRSHTDTQTWGWDGFLSSWGAKTICIKSGKRHEGTVLLLPVYLLSGAALWATATLPLLSKTASHQCNVTQCAGEIMDFVSYSIHRTMFFNISGLSLMTLEENTKPCVMYLISGEP